MLFRSPRWEIVVGNSMSATLSGVVKSLGEPSPGASQADPSPVAAAGARPAPKVADAARTAVARIVNGRVRVVFSLCVFTTATLRSAGDRAAKVL